MPDLAESTYAMASAAAPVNAPLWLVRHAQPLIESGICYGQLDVAADAGATFTAYTFIRLNGAIKLLFHDWLYKNFPNHADKVWHLIEQSHDGKVNDSRWGVRMRGEGNIAQIVAQQYKKYGLLYNMNAEEWSLDTSKFRVPGGQGKLF